MKLVATIFKLVVSALPMAFWNAMAIPLYWGLRLSGYREAVINKNLERSFPHYTTDEVKRTRLAFYQHFAQLLVEIIKMFGLSKSFIKQGIQLENKELIDQYYAEGKDVILVLGHYGNWEWGLLATTLMSEHEMVGIYKPLSSSFWDEQIKNLRAQFGATLVSMKSSLRYLLKKGDRPRLIGIIADQTPSADELNFWTTFLNQETPVFLGTEKLARKLDCPVVFVHIERQNRRCYKMSFELLTEQPNELAEGVLTKQHTDKLASTIQAKPAQWLWSHRRWKHQR